jgi:uncharacterized RDD family membrane protein YckC
VFHRTLAPASFAILLAALFLPFLTVTAQGCGDEGDDPLLTVTGSDLVRGTPGERHDPGWFIPEPDQARYDRALANARRAMFLVAVAAVLGLATSLLGGWAHPAPLLFALVAAAGLAVVPATVHFVWHPEPAPAGPTIGIAAEVARGWLLALGAAAGAIVVEARGHAERQPDAGAADARIAGGVVDLVLVSLTGVPVALVLGHVAPGLPLPPYIAAWVVVGAPYWIAQEGLGRHATLGQRMLGLRVVTCEGDDPAPDLAALRFLARLLALAAVVGAVLAWSLPAVAMVAGALFAPLAIGRRVAVHELVSATRVAA